MAKIIFTNREKMIWFTNLHNKQTSIADACNQIAGDLGGYGISLVDEDENDLSIFGNDEFIFQYSIPEKL
jgi:hypothetical protein